MNKLELILYLQELLDQCSNIEDLRYQLIRDELKEEEHIRIKEDAEDRHREDLDSLLGD